MKKTALLLLLGVASLFADEPSPEAVRAQLEALFTASIPTQIGAQPFFDAVNQNPELRNYFLEVLADSSRLKKMAAQGNAFRDQYRDTFNATFESPHVAALLKHPWAFLNKAFERFMQSKKMQAELAIPRPQAQQRARNEITTTLGLSGDSTDETIRKQADWLMNDPGGAEIMREMGKLEAKKELTETIARNIPPERLPPKVVRAWQDEMIHEIEKVRLVNLRKTMELALGTPDESESSGGMFDGFVDRALGRNPRVYFRLDPLVSYSDGVAKRSYWNTFKWATSLMRQDLSDLKVRLDPKVDKNLTLLPSGTSTTPFYLLPMESALFKWRWLESLTSRTANPHVAATKRADNIQLSQNRVVLEWDTEHSPSTALGLLQKILVGTPKRPVVVEIGELYKALSKAHLKGYFQSKQLADKKGDAKLLFIQAAAVQDANLERATYFLKNRKTSEYSGQFAEALRVELARKSRPSDESPLLSAQRVLDKPGDLLSGIEWAGYAQHPSAWVVRDEGATSKLSLQKKTDLMAKQNALKPSDVPVVTPVRRSLIRRAWSAIGPHARAAALWMLLAGGIGAGNHTYEAARYPSYEIKQQQGVPLGIVVPETLYIEAKKPDQISPERFPESQHKMGADIVGTIEAGDWQPLPRGAMLKPTGITIQRRTGAFLPNSAVEIGKGNNQKQYYVKVDPEGLWPDEDLTFKLRVEHSEKDLRLLRRSVWSDPKELVGSNASWTLMRALKPENLRKANAQLREVGLSQLADALDKAADAQGKRMGIPEDIMALMHDVTTPFDYLFTDASKISSWNWRELPETKSQNPFLKYRKLADSSYNGAFFQREAAELQADYFKLLLANEPEMSVRLDLPFTGFDRKYESRGRVGIIVAHAKDPNVEWEIATYMRPMESGRIFGQFREPWTGEPIPGYMEEEKPEVHEKELKVVQQEKEEEPKPEEPEPEKEKAPHQVPLFEWIAIRDWDKPIEPVVDTSPPWKPKDEHSELLAKIAELRKEILSDMFFKTRDERAFAKDLAPRLAVRLGRAVTDYITGQPIEKVVSDHSRLFAEDTSTPEALVASIKAFRDRFEAQAKKLTAVINDRHAKQDERSQMVIEASTGVIGEKTKAMLDYLSNADILKARRSHQQCARQIRRLQAAQ